MTRTLRDKLFRSLLCYGVDDNLDYNWIKSTLGHCQSPDDSHRPGQARELILDVVCRMVTEEYAVVGRIGSRHPYWQVDPLPQQGADLRAVLEANYAMIDEPFGDAYSGYWVQLTTKGNDEGRRLLDEGWRAPGM